MKRQRAIAAVIAFAFATLAIPSPVAAATSVQYAGPTPAAGGFADPNGLAIDSRGDLYISEHPSAQLATLSVLRARHEDDEEADEEGRSADATGTKTEIYRITALPSFTGPNIGSTAFDAAGNVYAVSGQHSVTDLLFVRRAIVRIDRRSHLARELFVATGLDPALGQPASTGIAVAHDGTVYFGRSNTLYRLGPDGSLLGIATFAATARVSSAPVIEVDGSLVVIVADGAQSSIYSIRSSGDVVRLAHVEPTERGVTGFLGAGVDAAGNFYFLQRVPHAFQHFTCAQSTTIRVFRLDGEAVRVSTTELTPAEVGSITQVGHLLFAGPGTQFLRVTRKGDVVFAVYPAFPFCPPAPFPVFPFSNQPTARRALAFVAQPDGTLVPHVLLDLPAPPIVLPGSGQTPHEFQPFAFAVRDRELFVSDGMAGTILRFERSRQAR